VAKYEVLPPESGNAEESSFGMSIVASSNSATSEIDPSVLDWLGQFCCRDLVRFYVFLVDEEASCSRVY
jgi:hypothetical protein